jgi:hypothetical protein
MGSAFSRFGLLSSRSKSAGPAFRSTPKLDPPRAAPIDAGPAGGWKARATGPAARVAVAVEGGTMSKPENNAAEARRRAQALLSDRRQAERVSERDRAQRAEAEKTARLRELRLAKEAEERAAKEQAKHRIDAARRGRVGAAEPE